VSFFFFLKRSKGFGGGGGPPAGGPAGCTFLDVSTVFLAVSFLCFLKGLIFLKSSPGGGGGPGGPGGGVCANACIETHNNPIINGSINKYFTVADRSVFLFGGMF